MNQTILRMIQGKLVDGRLPQDPLPRVCGGPGQGETCDGCGEIVTRAELAMENADGEHPIHFHVSCFYIWDAERRALNLESSPRLPARFVGSTSPTTSCAPTRALVVSGLGMCIVRAER
jgi:hypothetical protein